MISLEEVTTTINELESRPLTFSSAGNLAALYIVRDEIRAEEGIPKQATLSGSEFLEACSGVDMVALFDILDEHIDAIKAIYPKEYMALMQKIKLLKKE